MPYGREYKKRSKKNKSKYSKYRNKKYGYTKRLTNQGVPSGMPLQRLSKLRYCGKGLITTTLGALTLRTFLANGAFQVEPGIGGQPMGFDQWSVLFNHYVVLGSKCTVEISDASATKGEFVAGLYLNDDGATIYGNFLAFKEARRGQQKVITTQRNRALLNGKFSAKKFFGVKDVEDNTDRIGGTITTNPVEQALYFLYAEPLDGVSEIDMRYVITIDFIVLWSEPRDIPVST